MENTKFIYAANSDLDDELFYAEFETKDEAINYALDHLDKLPFVDEIELAYDAEGTEDAISYKTIWDHTMAVQEEVAAAEDEAFWDFRAEQEAEAQANKYDLGDTTWFESLDNLVENMEENEDMVECKECFDLFPKADCVKLAFGYICPHCNKSAEVADSDIFKVEFPEYEKFRNTGDEFDDSKLAMSDEDVARVNEPFEEPFSSNNSEETESEPELTAEEAVPFLVNDEVEAVAGYEKAAEVVADSDLANKEEILDTIDHIKEEEEEHIEELNDLVDDEIIEVENETTSEVAKEDEIEEIEDPEPTPLKEDSNSETRYWICFYDNNDVAVIEATDEDDAMEKFESSYNDEYFFDSWDHDWSVEEISKEEYDEWENSNSLFARLNLPEHVNKECAPIESDQKLEGTDNAVVDCKVADVVTHSEDEKPVDCDGKKKPLEKPLTEGVMFSLNNEKDLTEFTQLCKEVGMKTIGDLDRFVKETAEDKGTILDKLRNYKKELGDDFEIKEELNLQHGYPHIKSVATLVHTAVNNLTKDNRVGTRQDGTSFYVLSDKRSANPEQIKKTIVDTLAKNGYDPEVVQYVDKGQVYGFVVDKIRATSRMTLKYENLTEGVKFTKEEQEEFNMDEDGNSLDSYDTYVRCGWCDEIFTKDQCAFEANMGWLCDRCQSAITSRGERLTLITNPTEEDEARVLTEDVKDENEPISNDPEEKPSKNVKMANTASTSGMDFEAACEKFGINLEN